MNDKLKFYRETLVEMTKEAYRKKPKELKTDEAVDEAEILTKAIMQKVDEFEVAMEQHVILDEERRNYYFGGDNCCDPKFWISNNTNISGSIIDHCPQYPSDNKEELDYVCKLTQYDIDDIETRLNQVINYYKDFKENYITEEQFNEFTKRNISGVIGYLKDESGIRKKDQTMQLLVQKATKYKKSYGTLGEHWKELSELFYIKSNFEHWEKLFNDVIIPDLKLYGHVCPRTEFNIYYYKRVDDVYNSLGIEFIEDFVKACEKCEE